MEVKNYELFSAIRVTDTGPGIFEEEPAKIFRRFYRAPDAWQAEGAGIGLYLTRRIAEMQGGYVKVESAPGKGSTFSPYLPHETTYCLEKGCALEGTAFSFRFWAAAPPSAIPWWSACARNKLQS